MVVMVVSRILRHLVRPAVRRPLPISLGRDKVLALTYRDIQKLMARVCDRCGRGSNRAISRSHSNIATKRQQFVNLQAKKVDGQRMKVCTRCVRTMTKEAKA
jgi:ribosomal protein L28